MIFNARYVCLKPDRFRRDPHKAIEYIQTIGQALSAGVDLPLVSDMACACKTCRSCYTSLIQFMFALPAPSLLECPRCLKRIPVGTDIHELPRRIAQPDIVAINGTPLDLEASQQSVPIVSSSDAPHMQKLPTMVILWGYF